MNEVTKTQILHHLQFSPSPNSHGYLIPQTQYTLVSLNSHNLKEGEGRQLEKNNNMISGVAYLGNNFDCTSTLLCLRAPSLPFIPPLSLVGGNFKAWNKKETRGFRKLSNNHLLRKPVSIPKCSGSSSSGDTSEASSTQPKAPFGYTRKDVILIGVGVTVFGVGLKSGLEFVGVDPLQAGNVVQLVIVLGMTVGWISTYMFRVASKDMTYAQQLRDYESKVMEKRLEGLTEAELQVLLEQVEEEKRLANSEQVN